MNTSPIPDLEPAELLQLRNDDKLYYDFVSKIVERLDNDYDKETDNTLSAIVLSMFYLNNSIELSEEEIMEQVEPLYLRYMKIKNNEE